MVESRVTVMRLGLRTPSNSQRTRYVLFVLTIASAAIYMRGWRRLDPDLGLLQLDVVRDEETPFSAANVEEVIPVEQVTRKAETNEDSPAPTATPSSRTETDSPAEKEPTRDAEKDETGSVDVDDETKVNIDRDLNASFMSKATPKKWKRNKKVNGEEAPVGGAFVHVGKTGGSTLAGFLRNACHSYIPKPCGVIPNETLVSKLIGNIIKIVYCLLNIMRLSN